jgi:hypothetical protein
MSLRDLEVNLSPGAFAAARTTLALMEALELGNAQGRPEVAARIYQAERIAIALEGVHEIEVRASVMDQVAEAIQGVSEAIGDVEVQIARDSE